MELISSPDEKAGVEAMAQKITSSLSSGKKVLWLICGGSNIPYAKEAMDLIRLRQRDALPLLSIGQTDERYGEVGHKDSNWQQMIEANFNFEGVKTLPILRGKPRAETVAEYAPVIEQAFNEHHVVVAQFGIGADGHVAGMLPHTGGISAAELVFGYDSPPFVRITLTPPAFTHINAAYTFAFGAAKREAIDKLKQILPLEEEPCQILKTISESYFYSDQV